MDDDQLHGRSRGPCRAHDLCVLAPGALVDSWSDDRAENAEGAFAERRWSTPISGYREVEGLTPPGNR
jgi:hypothetical protein